MKHSITEKWNNSCSPFKSPQPHSFRNQSIFTNWNSSFPTITIHRPLFLLQMQQNLQVSIIIVRRNFIQNTSYFLSKKDLRLLPPPEMQCKHLWDPTNKRCFLSSWLHCIVPVQSTHISTSISQMTLSAYIQHIIPNSLIHKSTPPPQFTHRETKIQIFVFKRTHTVIHFFFPFQKVNR